MDDGLSQVCTYGVLSFKIVAVYPQILTFGVQSLDLRHSSYKPHEPQILSDSSRAIYTNACISLASSVSVAVLLSNQTVPVNLLKQL